MSRFSPLLAVFCVLVFASCDAASSPLLEPEATRPLIEDGRDASFTGSGVYLLPPINDNDYTRTGPFDVFADPRVEICRLDVQGALNQDNIEAALCEDGPAEFWFETDASYDGQTFVEVTPEPGDPATADSMFSVGWKTSTADADSAFRATILMPHLSFDNGTISVEYTAKAQFDVVLYDNASTKLDPDRIVGFNAGQNFPIKFIVEESAGCDGLDCYAYRVTCEGGLFETDHAGAFLPPDWAQSCTDPSSTVSDTTWWLFQQRVPEGITCPVGPQLDGIPYEPCYIWQLVQEVDGIGDASTFVPFTEEFVLPGTIQFCNNPEDEGGVPTEYVPLAGVFRYSSLPGEDPPYEVALVPGAEADILSNPEPCPYDGPTTTSTVLGLQALTDGVLRPALELIGLAPRPLYAGDTGTLSAKTIRMSHFQRVLELEIESTTDQTPSTVVGSSEQLGIRLVATPHHDDGAYVGVPDGTVQFEIVSGGDIADLTATSATSCGDDCIQVKTSDAPGFDDDGLASVLLSISGDAPSGTVEVVVTVPGDPNFTPFYFNVEVVDLILAFLEPLETGDFYGSPDELFAPTVLICEDSLTPCTASQAETVIGTADIKLVEENGRKFYQADWKPRDTNTAEGGTFRVQVLADGMTVGYSIPIVTTKGGKSERVEDVYYNGVNSSVPLKFTITRAGM